jgi:hypothetical protein
VPNALCINSVVAYVRKRTWTTWHRIHLMAIDRFVPIRWPELQKCHRIDLLNFPIDSGTALALLRALFHHNRYKQGAIMAIKRKKRFPKKELNSWVKKRSSWNHDEWLALLDELRSQGFEEWTDNTDGQDEIGRYIESKRA